MATAPTKQILMSDMFINNNVVGSRYFKVSAASQKESDVAKGIFFAGSVNRTGVVIDDTHYSVISTGDKYAIIDGIDVFFNFGNSVDGHFLFEMKAYVESSNSNNFSYTPISPIPAGTPLSAEFVNNKSLLNIDLGVTATLSGIEDYLLFSEDMYIDTSGNRNSRSETSATLIDSGRVLIIPPNTKVLIQSVISGGTGSNSTDIRTSFYFKEYDAKSINTGVDI